MRTLLLSLLLLNSQLSQSQTVTEPTDLPNLLYSNPIYLNGYAEGVVAGMNQCRRFPASCGLDGHADFSTLPLTDAEENITIQVINGLTHCQQNPSSCGITVDYNTDGSTETGIEQCQRDPVSCGIETQGSKQEGISQCRLDPMSCGINLDRDSLLEEGKNICRINPLECGIISTSTPLHGHFDIETGWLHLPAVDVSNLIDKDGTVTYTVGMQLIVGREPLSFSLVEAVPIK